MWIFSAFSLTLILKEAKRFGLLVALPDQDGKVSDLNTGHTNKNKNSIYCFLLRLSKRNALAVKASAHTLCNRPLDKGIVIQRAVCLIR